MLILHYKYKTCSHLIKSLVVVNPGSTSSIKLPGGVRIPYVGCNRFLIKLNTGWMNKPAGFAQHTIVMFLSLSSDHPVFFNKYFVIFILNVKNTNLSILEILEASSSLDVTIVSTKSKRIVD